MLTLARLYRKYIQQGSLDPKTLLVVGELSLCTTWDFADIIPPTAKSGATLWLLGDCRNQLLSIAPGTAWICQGI